MSDLLDSSVLIAALIPDEPGHAESLALLKRGDCAIYLHALHETFSTLTGGRMAIRVDAGVAARMLRESISPQVTVVALTTDEVLDAIDTARRHGVRGGAIYDYMHLVAARKANAATLHTLNLDDFLHLRRSGDPEIRCP